MLVGCTATSRTINHWKVHSRGRAPWTCADCVYHILPVLLVAMDGGSRQAGSRFACMMVPAVWVASWQVAGAASMQGWSVHP
jgi:hypothetical protein